MAKKKKKIVHIYRPGNLTVVCGGGLNGFSVSTESMIGIVEHSGSYRLCHKCNHIHKKYLAAQKLTSSKEVVK